MIEDTLTEEVLESGRCESPKLSRRSFVQLLGTGLLITVTEGITLGQRRRGGGGRSVAVAARIHVNADGTISVMTGKVEEGQGCRTQLLQAAAEELRVGVDRIRMVLSDTGLVPDDGMTAGSRTTPSTVPAVPSGAIRRKPVATNCDWPESG